MRRNELLQNRMLVLVAAFVVALALSGCGADDTADDVTEVDEDEDVVDVEEEEDVADVEDVEEVEDEEAADEDPHEAIRAMLPDRIVESGTIVVSNPLQNPPYAFMLEDGVTLQGIAPDLSRALEPILGVEFEWVDTAFPGLIPGLQAEEFDMIWGSITNTEEREEILDFVTYHMDGAVLLVAAGNPEGIGSLEDTCGLTISTLEGAVQIEMLEEQSDLCVEDGQEPLDIALFPSVPDGQLSVRSGQTHAFLAGLGAARYQATVSPDVFEAVGPVYQAAPFGAAFRKGDELIGAIQEGLKLLVRDSTYTSILDEYGMAPVALSEDQIMVNGAAALSREELILDE